MANINKIDPAVIEKVKDLLLGEGIVYKNYGEVGEAIIGATRGGSKLEIEKEIKEIEFDGSLGATKGMRRPSKFIVRLIINFLKINYVNLAYGVNVTVTDGSDALGTYKKITFNTSFASTDVLTNITFKGYKASGEYCVIRLDNAFNMNDISFEFKEKDEIISEMTYTSFYKYLTPSVCGLYIDEEEAS